MQKLLTRLSSIRLRYFAWICFGSTLLIAITATLLIHGAMHGWVYALLIITLFMPSALVFLAFMMRTYRVFSQMFSMGRMDFFLLLLTYIFSFLAQFFSTLLTISYVAI